MHCSCPTTHVNKQFECLEAYRPWVTARSHSEQAWTAMGHSCSQSHSQHKRLVKLFRTCTTPSSTVTSIGIVRCHQTQRLKPCSFTVLVPKLGDAESTQLLDTRKGLQPYPGAVNIAILEGLFSELTRRGHLDSLSAGPVNQEEDLKFDVDFEDDWLTFIDEISGKPLSAQLVVKAREEELSFARKYGGLGCC